MVHRKAFDDVDALLSTATSFTEWARPDHMVSPSETKHTTAIEQSASTIEAIYPTSKHEFCSPYWTFDACALARHALALPYCASLAQASEQHAFPGCEDNEKCALRLDEVLLKPCRLTSDLVAPGAPDWCVDDYFWHAKPWPAAATPVATVTYAALHACA